MQRVLRLPQVMSRGRPSEARLGDPDARIATALPGILHLNAHVKPIFRNELAGLLAREIFKVNHVEQVAWQRFHKSQRPQRRETIEKGLVEGTNGNPSYEGVIKRVVQKTTRTGEACWLQVVQWCIEWRSKMGGWYKAHESARESSEFRVAGRSVSEIDREMLNRLGEAIKERAEYEEAIKAWEGKSQRGRSDGDHR